VAAGSGFVGSTPGYFFCARIGEEVFMRFLPEEPDEVGDEIVRDTLTCFETNRVYRGDGANAPSVDA
jgi:hypothetical protein